MRIILGIAVTENRLSLWLLLTIVVPVVGKAGIRGSEYALIMASRKFGLALCPKVLSGAVMIQLMNRGDVIEVLDWQETDYCFRSGNG